MTNTLSELPSAGGELKAPPLLEVKDLRIERINGGETIVSSVGLDLREGETIGIVGESGSGKSMTARALIGLLPSSLVARGEMTYRGQSLVGQTERQWRSVRGREIGLMMQDPFTILNPVMRCGRILEESLVADDRDRRKIRGGDEVIRRLGEVGITDESVARRYPFQLSGGMRQRVALASALARDPRVLIADEPSTALDVITQREILALLKSIQRARGMSLILITHDLRVAFGMCDRIYVLYAGSLVEVGPPAELEANPFHPYTEGLLMSEPPLDRRVGELLAIPGAVPRPDDVSDRCTFAPRCRWVKPVCVSGPPPLTEVTVGRLSACVRINEIREEMRHEVQTRDADPVSSVVVRKEPIVVVRDLRKVFGEGTRQVSAVDGVTLQIGEDESVGLVGESGSGKTTVARTLVGLEHASGGEIVIDGTPARDWSKLSNKERRRLRGTVQVVFQDPYSSINPMRTVGWTLKEAITVNDRSARRLDGQVAELLEAVGLDPAYARRKPVALSGGERQRVAIARALAVKPRLLICDEPVSALDVSVQAQILNLFASLRRERGISYFFITHDLSIVRQIVDYVYVMHRGRLVESGPVTEVLDRPTDPYTIKLLASVPRSDPEWFAARTDAGTLEPARGD